MSTKINGTFSEVIPNESGIPCQNKNSEKIRRAHRQWKKAVRAKRKKQKDTQISYWQRMSSCTSL